MSILLQFVTALLTAAFVENIIFTRSLGTSWVLYLVRNPKNFLEYTGLLGAVSLVSAMLCYPLRRPLSGSGSSYVLLPMVSILCVIAVYVAVYFLLRRFWPVFLETIKDNMTAAVFNGVMLGGLLIPAIERLDFAGTVGYSLGTTLGFAVAVLLIGFGMERIRLCHVPKAFRGLPVVLIYLGLLSLAFYGLVGHQLPT